VPWESLGIDGLVTLCVGVGVGVGQGLALVIEA
jgi:hypothetical protein